MADRLLRAPALDGGAEDVRDGLEEQRLLAGEGARLAHLAVDRSIGAPWARDRHADATDHARVHQACGGREAVLAREVLHDRGTVRLQYEAGEGARAGGHGERSNLVGERAVGGGQREVPGVGRELPHLAMVEPELFSHELRHLLGELGQRHALEPAAAKLGDCRLARRVAA